MRRCLAVVVTLSCSLLPRLAAGAPPGAAAGTAREGGSAAQVAARLAGAEWTDPLLSWGPESRRRLSALASSGEEGLRAAVALAAGLPVRDRPRALEHLRRAVEPDVTSALISGELHRARALLTVLAASGESEDIGQLAAFLALTDLPPTQPSTRLQAHLLRARGESGAALSAARAAGDERLVEGLLFELGRAAELADLAVRVDDPVRAIGLRAALLSWTGDAAGARAALDALVDAGRERPEEGAAVASALLLNGRVDDALDLLVASGERLLAFDLLVSERRYAEALRLSESSPDLSDKEAAELALRRARLLGGLEQGDSAGAALAEVANAGLRSEDPNRVARALAVRVRLGDDGEALRQAAEALERLPEGRSPGTILGSVFAPHRRAAEAAWAWARDAWPEESAADALDRVRDALSKDAAPAELELLVEQALARSAVLPVGEWERRLGGLAELADLHGMADRALSISRLRAELSGGQAAWRDLGDRLGRAGSWQEAAAAFEKGWSAHPSDPALLVARAHALERAGRSDEARADLDLASLLPLGDPARRHRLAAELKRRGWAAEASAQRDWILRLAPHDSWYYGVTLRTLGAQAGCAGNVSAAASSWERARVQELLAPRALRPPAAAAVGPRAAASLLAAAVESGDLASVLELSAAALGPLLADLDATADVVAAFEAAGNTAEAEWIARRVHERLRDEASAFPESARLQNSLAWFGARTRRELGVALAAAQRAVLLRPDAAGYHDTLAEVLFQRGDAAGALAQIERALELSPGSEYLQGQRVRFEGGDPGLPPAVSR